MNDWQHLKSQPEENIIGSDEEEENADLEYYASAWLMKQWNQYRYNQGIPHDNQRMRSTDSLGH